MLTLIFFYPYLCFKKFIKIFSSNLIGLKIGFESNPRGLKFGLKRIQEVEESVIISVKVGSWLHSAQTVDFLP